MGTIDFNIPGMMAIIRVRVESHMECARGTITPASMEVQSIVRAHHFCKRVWTPVTGEVGCTEDNVHNCHAVAVPHAQIVQKVFLNPKVIFVGNTPQCAVKYMY